MPPDPYTEQHKHRKQYSIAPEYNTEDEACRAFRGVKGSKVRTLRTRTLSHTAHNKIYFTLRYIKSRAAKNQIRRMPLKVRRLIK